MSEIELLRNRMDKITLEMIRLLKTRTDVAEQIGQLKRSMGRGVTDRQREESLLQSVRLLCGELGLDEALGSRLLNFLLSESVSVQSAERLTHLSIFMRAKQMEARGRRVIHMEVGEPDFGPPAVVGERAAEALEKGYRRYGPAKGRVELREAFSRYASDTFGATVPVDHIMVTPGGRFGAFLAVSMLSPGDEIVVVEPAWPAYAECARHAGVRVRTVRTRMDAGWMPDEGQIRRAMGPNTKMLVLNYPNNPTGAVMPPRVQDRIMEDAMERDVYVLSDEIYWRYAYAKWKSVLEYDYPKSIVVQSLSKSHAMTGFRIGYIMAHPPVLERMAKLQSLSMTCVAEPMQYAAMVALEANISTHAEIVRSRLQAITTQARRMGLEFAEPQGAMYLFAGLGRCDGTHLANELLKRGVAVAPGEAFGDYGGYIRISACQNEKVLIEGMNILASVWERMR